jgi:Ca2+-binding RTX toxin-like protein
MRMIDFSRPELRVLANSDSEMHRFESSRPRAGIDTVSYKHAASGVNVSLAINSAQNTGGAGSDTLSGFENLTGSASGDVLTGSSGANVLNGLAGNDTLKGGGGADTWMAGIDKFLFTATADSSPSASARSSSLTSFGSTTCAAFDAASAVLMLVAAGVPAASSVIGETGAVPAVASRLPAPAFVIERLLIRTRRGDRSF